MSGTYHQSDLADLAGVDAVRLQCTCASKQKRGGEGTGRLGRRGGEGWDAGGVVRGGCGSGGAARAARRLLTERSRCPEILRDRQTHIHTPHPCFMTSPLSNVASLRVGKTYQAWGRIQYI